MANTTKSFSQKFHPWIIWFLGASFFFYKYLLQVSPSVMSFDLMQTFAMTGAQLGNLAACFFYAYLLMQLPVGLLLDKFNVRTVMLCAIFVCTLGTLFFANAHSIWLAGLSRALLGFGAAFAAVSCFKLATLWFPPERFAFVAGLSMTAAMLGAVGGEAPLSLMVTAWGWREAMLMIALCGFLLMILTGLFIKDKTPHTSETIAQNPVSFAQMYQQIKTILCAPQTWLLSFYSGLAFAPISVFGGLWGVSFIEQAYHLKADQAASSISYIFLGFALGCPISGWLSDSIKRRKILMFFGTITALLMMIKILYFPPHHYYLLNLFMFLFGLSGSCFFICFSMIREIHPVIFAATVLGFMNMFDSIYEALTEPLIGKLLDMNWDGTLIQGTRIFKTHDYHIALLILPFYLLVAFFLLLFIKETYCQSKVS